ncbi:methyltransferase domain-containing protein [candidate division KSB1 bacterium]|nr:methyltransferase domain-containing protein [candidate division KSB1 bacterium]
MKRWYEETFGDDYVKIYMHRDRKEAIAQIDFLVRHTNLQRNDLCFDLGCGAGRHSIELARRGYRVIGLDLSSPLLRLAQKKAKTAGMTIQLVRGDMRHLPFRCSFDIVCSFFTTFGYFDSDSENLSVLIAVYNILKPGGTFLIDYLNKTQAIDELVPVDEKVINGIIIRQERSYDSRSGRLNKNICVIRGTSTRCYVESVRAYSPIEMQRMLETAGFESIKIFGNFDDSPFDRNSPRLIMLAQRK